MITHAFDVEKREREERKRRQEGLKRTTTTNNDKKKEDEERERKKKKRQQLDISIGGGLIKNIKKCMDIPFSQTPASRNQQHRSPRKTFPTHLQRQYKHLLAFVAPWPIS